MTTTRTSMGAAGLVAAALVSAGLAGCSAKVETSKAPTVSAADLQRDLTERLSKAGDDPKSVTCNADLTGEVGKSASCEVVMSETNVVQVNTTVDKVDGKKIDFTYSPALTQEQLQKTVKGMAAAESVTCESGLDGKVGATAKCQIIRDGNATDANVEATKVEGLAIDLTITS